MKTYIWAGDRDKMDKESDRVLGIKNANEIDPRRWTKVATCFVQKYTNAW
jgi:hypothetical protein